MPNPLFNALGGGRMPGPMGQFQQMMQQFQQFRNNFQGDPKQEVEKLLRDPRGHPGRKLQPCYAGLRHAPIC